MEVSGFFFFFVIDGGVIKVFVNVNRELVTGESRRKDVLRFLVEEVRWMMAIFLEIMNVGRRIVFGYKNEEFCLGYIKFEMFIMFCFFLL